MLKFRTLYECTIGPMLKFQDPEVGVGYRSGLIVLSILILNKLLSGFFEILRNFDNKMGPR